MTPTTTKPTARKPSSCGSVGPTCDAVPKVDGIYRVSDGGVLSTGIMATRIVTAGPRAGSNHCSWARLSGPKLTIADTIDTGMVRSVDEGPVVVEIDRSDYAFFSDGCQPWRRVK